MKYIGIGIIILLGALLIFWRLILKNESPVQNNKTVQNSKQTQVKEFSPQLDSKGEVIVETKPIVLLPNREATFSISFNTHSVELDYDLVSISKLVINKSNVFRPLSWSGGTGGHHINGKLIFPKIPGHTQSVELVLEKIAGFDRRFTWNL